MTDLDLDTLPPGVDHETPGGAVEGAGRPVVPEQSPEDADERALRPTTLGEFVGQDRLRAQLSVFIDAARGGGEPLDHTLFAGPPGLGKCVTPDTLLYTPQGLVPIGELGELRGESWQPITRPVAGLYGTKVANYFYDNGGAETRRMTTRSGYRIEGTLNHPLLVRGADGAPCFRQLGEIRAGDEVAVRLGAGVYGSATRLHIDGLRGPTYEDPARVPDELTGEFARLLGLLLAGARIDGSERGIIVRLRRTDQEQELRRLLHEVLCMELEPLGDGLLGGRFLLRSARLAHALAWMGLGNEGFARLPGPIYRAPRQVVGEFLQGVFWGNAEEPQATVPVRAVAAHLQLLLANAGIESVITPGAAGYLVRIGHAAAEVAAGHGVEPSRIVVERTDARAPGDGLQASFGIRPAGWQALPEAAAHDHLAAEAAVPVAEVEPSERVRAVAPSLVDTDHGALAVRSVSSELRRDELVELVWEPVVDVQPGLAHTCDVSVPDGHTFIGNGIVCHNTTLASIVAREMGSALQQTSGPALEKKADVAAILTALEPGDVLFIDEIHRLATPIEEVLYSAMEDYRIDIVLGQGPAARSLRLEVAPFTLVGATTRTGLLTTPLRDRFGLIHRLEYYTPAELARVITRSASLLEIEIAPDAAAELARRSRGTPRIANRLLRRVRDVAQVRHDGSITLDVAREALDLVDVDHVGLDRIDRQLLEHILLRFGGGPVGLNTLAVAIGEEPTTIEDVYEPYLIQQGLLQRTARGRMLTAGGRQHLAALGVHAGDAGTTLFER